MNLTLGSGLQWYQVHPEAACSNPLRNRPCPLKFECFKFFRSFIMVHSGESRSSIKDGAIDFTAGSLGKHPVNSDFFNDSIAQDLYLFILNFQEELPWYMLDNH